jgi:hypothetical protein
VGNRQTAISLGMALGVALWSNHAARAADIANTAPPAELSTTMTGLSPDRGVAIGGWQGYPSMTIGSVFNDNIYQRPTNRAAGIGLRVRPDFAAILDNGLHKTSLYLSADGQFYPGHGASLRYLPTPTVDHDASNITGRAGFSHRWVPLADLTVDVIADYTRMNGLFGSNFGGSGYQQVTLLSANTVSAGQQVSNQYSGYISVEKKIGDRGFVRGTTGAQYIAYDSRAQTPDFVALQTAANPNFGLNGQNGLGYSASLRGGYYVTPQIYAFVEPAADLRFYRNSAFDTNGYRITGGLGSDLISLFRGEVYGGYQRQISAHDNFGSADSPAFGARLFYYPTRYLTLTASFDQTLSAGAQQAANTGALLPLSVVQGLRPTSSSKTLQARLQADYNFSEYWTAYVRGGYGETNFSAPTTTQTVWTTGLGVNYTFWRNLSLTGEYQFSRTFASNAGGLLSGAGYYGYSVASAALLNGSPSGYTQNVVSLGVTYRY